MDTDPSMFLNLPFEMQAEVFNYFKLPERQQLRRICRTWDLIIGQLFEIHLNVVDLLPVLRTNARFLTVSFAGTASSRIHKDSMFIAFCSRIQTLWLSGFILTENCRALLRHCSSLKKLVIDNILLSSTKQYPADSRKLKTWVPKIQYLRFNAGQINESDIYLLTLLAKVLEFGKLQKFRVNIKQDIGYNFFDTSYVTGNDAQSELLEPETPEPFLEAVNNIICFNRPTLRHIRVESLQGPLFNYKNLYMDTYQPAKTFSELYIKSFTTVDTMLQPNLKPSPWLQLLARQQYLQELSLTSFDRQSLFSWTQEIASNIVTRNAATLTVIDLDFAASVLDQKPAWDAAVFSSCKNLKRLELRLWPMHTYNYYILAGYVPSLHNVEQLPSSLITFATNFTISSPATELRYIQLHNLKNLRTLQLYGVPWFTMNGRHKPSLSVQNFQYLSAKLPSWRLMYLMINQFGKLNAAGTWKVYRTLSNRLLKKSNKIETFDGEKFIKLTNSSKRSSLVQAQTNSSSSSSGKQFFSK